MENGEVIEHQNPTQETPEAIENVSDVVQQEAEEASPDQEVVAEDKEEKTVPLAALQKERKRRQEAEMNAEFQKQQFEKAQKNEPEDDSYKYESATKEDLMKAQQEAIRQVEEKRWIKENPEKFELLNENLSNFLKQKPHFVTAIDSVENRYEEAYSLMTAFNPRPQQQAKKQKIDREAPHSPSTVPKTAAMNAKVDVMSMSDSEFKTWQKGLKKRRRTC